MFRIRTSLLVINIEIASHGLCDSFLECCFVIDLILSHCWCRYTHDMLLFHYDYWLVVIPSADFSSFDRRRSTVVVASRRKFRRGGAWNAHAWVSSTRLISRFCTRPKEKEKGKNVQNELKGEKRKTEEKALNATVIWKIVGRGANDRRSTRTHRPTRLPFSVVIIIVGP